MWALIITLIVVGLLLLGIEVLVIPGFGLTGILGIGSFIASCYLAFVTFGAMCGLTVIAINVLLFILLIMFVLRSGTWKKLSLSTNINSKTDELPKDKGLAVGMKGVTLTRLAPGGHARIGDVSTEVFSRGSLIEAGRNVEITEVEENRIFVKEY